MNAKQTKFVVAICPTKGRPKLIPNVLAMWNSQDYNPEHRHLVIWDDQPNFEDAEGDNWSIQSFEHNSLGHISQKYYRMVKHVLKEYQPDYIAVWEDDDVYLSHHLSLSVACSEATRSPVVRNGIVWTNHPGGTAVARLYPAGAAYHGTWIFTPDAYYGSGGYRNGPIEGFDTDFCRRLTEQSKVSSIAHQEGIHPSVVGYWDAHFPSYVYRFGTTGYPNASAYGPDFSKSYDDLHDDMGQYPVPEPKFDAETALLRGLPSGKLPSAIRADPESVRNGLAL